MFFLLFIFIFIKQNYSGDINDGFFIEFEVQQAENSFLDSFEGD